MEDNEDVQYGNRQHCDHSKKAIWVMENKGSSIGVLGNHQSWQTAVGIRRGGRGE